MQALQANGAITTQNLVPNGPAAATAGSAVELDVLGMDKIAIQVVGTYTGALTLQGTVDGVNWITFGGTPVTNINTGVAAANIASATQGIFMATIGGMKKVRVTGLAAMTGSAAVPIRSNRYS